MISLIRGTVIEKTTDSIIVDVGGVGYELFLPLPVLAQVGAVGETVRLRTHLDVKEDSLTLFGFIDGDQLDMFRILTSVSRVGSRAALTILSTLDVPSIVTAVVEENHPAFTAVSGVGKKLAQRICLEITEKVRRRWPTVTSVVSHPVRRDGISPDSWELARQALIAQGFKPSEVERRLQWAQACVEDGDDLSNILREALRYSD